MYGFITYVCRVSASVCSCSTDYLQVFSVTTEKAVTTETLVGHYCGDSYIPGPIVTSHEAHMLKVTFQSDNVDARIGFSARYEFIDKKSYSKSRLTDSQGNLVAIL